MVQSAESLVRKYPTRSYGTNPAVRCPLLKSEMRAILMMVTNILREQSLQMAFIERNNVVQQVSSTASDPTLRYTVLPGTPERGSHRVHLQGSNCRWKIPTIFRISIEDQKLGSGTKGKRLAQLLDDPTTRRMLCDVNVQDASPIMADDEEAVEHAERDRWHSEEIRGRNRFPMVSKEGQPALGPVRISRRSLHPAGEVLSESSKPSIRSSPCIRGAPQVGFSTTIRKINSRTFFGVGFLPTCLRTLENQPPVHTKPVRCQRTLVAGVTMMRDCFQADQTRRAITQKSISKRSRLGRRCRRFSATSC